jgi:hypothetical protein
LAQPSKKPDLLGLFAGRFTLACLRESANQAIRSDGFLNVKAKSGMGTGLCYQVP